ncbi:MAG: hypothetical protein GY769_16035 [bacterium]|nr:hypothetical protein [bacterium]
MKAAKDDVRTALRVLEILPRFGVGAVGSDDPDELRKDAIIDKIDRQDRLRRRFGMAAAGEEVIEMLEDGGLLIWPNEEPADEE